MDTIKQLINKFSLISKKSLGQNFILDENITDKIVRFSDIKDQFVIILLGKTAGNKLAIYCFTRKKIDRT